jgi:hypothetical protein
MLKSIKKHFNLINLITGLITLLFILSIKELGLAIFILNIFKEHMYNVPENSESIIVGVTGLIFRLGLKGLIEEGFKEVFPTYNTMTLGGDSNSGINPVENNSSAGIKETTSGGSSSPSNSAGVQDSLSNNGKNPEKASDSATSSSQKPVHVPSNFSSKRYVEIFDKQAQRIDSEIKVLSAEISNCQDEEEKAFKEEDLEELFAQLSMLSKESVAETRKVLGSDSQTSHKRPTDSTVAQDSSKKRS